MIQDGLPLDFIVETPIEIYSGTTVFLSEKEKQQFIKYVLPDQKSFTTSDVGLLLDSILNEEALVVDQVDGSQSITFHFEHPDLIHTYNLVFQRQEDEILNGYLLSFEMSPQFREDFLAYRVDESRFQGTVRFAPITSITQILEKSTEDCFRIVFDSLDDINSDPSDGSGGTASDGGFGPPSGGTNFGTIYGGWPGGSNDGPGDGDSGDGDSGDGSTGDGSTDQGEPCISEWKQVLITDDRGRVIRADYILVRRGDCPDENLWGGDQTLSSEGKNLSGDCNVLLQSIGVILRPFGGNASQEEKEAIDFAANGTPYNVNALYSFLDPSALSTCMAGENDGPGCIREQILPYLNAAIDETFGGTLHNNFPDHLSEEHLADYFHAIYGSGENENIMAAANFTLGNLNDPAVSTNLYAQLLHLAQVSEALGDDFAQYAGHFINITGGGACEGPGEARTDYLLRNPEELTALGDFIDARLPDDVANAQEYAQQYLDMKNEDPEYVWERFEELYEMVENNPNFFVEDCPPGIEDWQDLASFELSGAPLDRINSSNGRWRVQDIADAFGTRVNLDYFAIHVDQLPRKDGGTGDRFSPEELFQYFRLNINDFADKFTPDDYDGDAYDDEAMWNSNNPLGAIINITMLRGVGNEDAIDGDVICAQFDPCCWIFSTLRAPAFESGIHPVSGNRQFGYTYNSSGQNKFVLFTRGADRTTTWYHSLNNSETAFQDADDFWRGMQTEFEAFVNTNGGFMSANPTPEAILRPDWEAVKEQLKGGESILNVDCH